MTGTLHGQHEPTANFAPVQPPRKPGMGWLGCLGNLVVILALGIVLVLAITGVFAPWAFYLGGKFHIIPYWQGWGTLQAKSGDYVVFVQFEPTPRGSRILPASNLRGTAFLCSPRGERFRMHLGGSMRAHLNLSTDGEAIRLYMDNWPLFSGQFMGEHRPSIELRGHWQNPNLVMDDHSSIFRAFLPDGNVYRGHDPNHPYNGEIVPVTLKQGSYSEFEASCSAVHR